MAAYQIDIHNAQSSVLLEEAFLRDVAVHVLQAERVAAAQISIALVDNATIRRLNRDYLSHDEETDVLSFLLDSSVRPAPARRGDTCGGAASADVVPRGAGKRLEGEVVISAEMAAAVAPDFRWTPRDEVVLYLVHGLLHLAGYDDLDPAERRLMRRRECVMLERWGLAPHYVREVDSSSAEGCAPSADDASGGDS